MRNFIREYFHYTRTERNGFIVLLTLCILSALFPKIYRTLYPPEKFTITITGFPSAKKEKTTTKNLVPFDPNTATIKELTGLGLSNKIAQRILNYRSKGGSFSRKQDFKKIYGLSDTMYLQLAPYIEIEHIANTIPRDIPTAYNTKTTPRTPSTTVVELFSFDPNTVSKKDLIRLGLKEKTANTILNFRSKGHFRTPQDFRKIFGLSEADYTRLKPFILIEKKDFASTESTKKTTFPPSNKTFEKPIIDINLAAVEEWQLLNGIGLTYARRIVDFRTKLGGFHTIKQVSEVYGIQDSTFQKILPQLKFSTIEINKLNINKVDVKSLQRHPYLKWKQAQTIINYRDNHGSYQDLNSLYNIRSFDSLFIQKVTPYLSVE